MPGHPQLYEGLCVEFCPVTKQPRKHKTNTELCNMATYIYQCPKCEVEEEHEHSMKICPVITHSCNTPMKKVIQPIAISFKGSGFYVNDSNKTKT